MLRTILVIAAFVMSLAQSAAPATASDASDIMSVIQQFNNAGNAGNLKTYAAYCANDFAIIDRVPPYVFRGSSACADNWNAVVAWEKQKGIVDGGIRLSSPLAVFVTGESAYAVVPATNMFTRNGQSAVELADWTFSLRRLAGKWRITGWTWAVRKAHPFA
jgi:ketosteroid isomerase-like protein